MTQFMPNPNCTSNTNGWGKSGPITITATADGMRIRRTEPGFAYVYSPWFNSGSQNVWLSNMIVRKNTASSAGLTFCEQSVASNSDGDFSISGGKSFSWKTPGQNGRWVYYPRSVNLRNNLHGDGKPYQCLIFLVGDGSVDLTIRSMVVHNAATLPASRFLAPVDAGMTFGVPSDSLSVTLTHDAANTGAIESLGVRIDGVNVGPGSLSDDAARFPTITRTLSAGAHSVQVQVQSPDRDGYGGGQVLLRDYTITVPSGTFSPNFVHETDFLFASFDGSSSIYPANSAPTTWAWNFGDGSPIQSSSSKFASHQYAIAGTYLVSLTIWNAIRPAVTVTKPVVVVAVPGSLLDFNAQIDRLSVEFVCLTPGTAASWDFGDGNTGTGLSVVHTYATAGTYTVTMTVDAASTSREITVTESSTALNIVDALRLEIQQDQGESVPWNRVSNPSGTLSAAGWLVGPSTPAAKISASPAGLTLTSGSNAPNVPQAYTARIPILQGRWAAASFTLISIAAGCYVRMRLEFADAAGAIIDGSAWSPYLAAPGRVQTTPMKTPAAARYAIVTVRLTGAASETAPSAGKQVTWRQTMAATSIWQSAVTDMPYNEGQVWADILGPTHEIAINRSELDVSTLQAAIFDAELDPAVSDTIRPGAAVRLRAAVDQGDGTQVWEPLYTGRCSDAQVTYEQSDLLPVEEQQLQLAPNPTITTTTDTYEDASAYATLTATADGGKLVVTGAATTGWDWAIAFKFLVRAGRRYRIRWRGRRVAGTGGTLRMRLRAFRSDGPDLGAVPWDVIAPAPASGTETARVGSTTLGEWVETECVVEPGAIPTDAENCNLWWTPTAAARQAPNGEWTVTDLTVAEEWTPAALPARRKATKIQLTAWDAASNLANTAEPHGVGLLWEIPSLMAGSAIPVVVDGEAGSSSAATVVAVNDNASLLDQVVAARDTQLGYAHVSRAGVLTLNTPAGVPTVPIATIDETVYSAADVQFATGDAINSLIVRWLRIDGDDTLETRYGPYEDTASVQRWGLMRQEVTWQGLTESAPAIEAQARTLLAANSVPVRRVHEVRIPIRYVTDLTRARALLDLMDLVAVRHERTGLDVPLRITEIAHQIVARPDRARPVVWSMRVGFNADGSSARPIAIPSPPVTISAPALPFGSVGSVGGGTQSLPNNSITKVTDSIMTVVATQGGMTWNSANDRFTVPKDGIYLFSSAAGWTGHATGVRRNYSYVNGVSAGGATTPVVNNLAFNTQWTTTLKLNAGDYVEFFAYQNSGGALGLVNFTGFTLTYLGT